MTLKVIQHILCDEVSGASCCFFVGTYRSNEVSSNHAVFRLMTELGASKVSTQKLTLDGVKREDLNALISDALCIFPRLTRGLSTIIHEKTEGSK
jgi:predicted ATPase